MNEVRKTIRKVNAFEKIVIPDLKETVHYIECRPEKNERDMVTPMKMVKQNLNGKIKKRTSVVGLFPSVESVLRLVSAVLMETDERWLTGKRYLNMNIGAND
jgi:putative transposase